MTSTSSIVILPCISFIALPAFFIATSVSWLMFADSIEYICCSSIDICPFVCSRECSCCFLRLRALRAAMPYQCQHQLSTINNTPRSSLCLLHPCMLGGRRPTSLIRTNILPRNLILLRHLILQMPFPLLQHIELLPQINDSFLRCIFPLLR